jgi:hypothetical protein
MKKALGRWGQKAGESVGMVKRTTEVDEDFTRQVAAADCRKDVQEKLVRHLTPESMKGTLFAKNDLSQEEKMGDFLVKSGNTLASTNDGSAYASALIAMGEMLKEIGEQHRQTDATIDERTIQPMKHFLDTKHVPLSSCTLLRVVRQWCMRVVRARARRVTVCGNVCVCACGQG